MMDNSIRRRAASIAKRDCMSVELAARVSTFWGTALPAYAGAAQRLCIYWQSNNIGEQAVRRARIQIRDASNTEERSTTRTPPRRRSKLEASGVIAASLVLRCGVFLLASKSHDEELAVAFLARSAAAASGRHLRLLRGDLLATCPSRLMSFFGSKNIVFSAPNLFSQRSGRIPVALAGEAHELDERQVDGGVVSTGSLLAGNVQRSSHSRET